jgi:hypothetical protein
MIHPKSQIKSIVIEKELTCRVRPVTVAMAVAEARSWDHVAMAEARPWDYVAEAVTVHIKWPEPWLCT